MDRTGLCERDHSHALTNTTRFEYDPVGRLITTTAAIGRMTVNAYDNADHLIAVTNNYTTTSAQQNYRSAYNLITRYGYDGFGRQIAVTDTHGFVTRTGYDNLNRPVTVTQNYKGNGIFDPSKPDENVRRITRYDPAGNVVEQIDPLGNVTRNGYDSLNRVISTTTNYTTTPGVDPNTYNLTTRYEYDPAGNQVAITDTLQHVTRNYYDKVGRLISTTLILKDDSGEMMPSGQTGPFTSPLSTPAPFTSPLLPTSNLPPNGAPPPVFDPSLLIIAPVALAAVVARKKGRKGALFVAVLTGTLVIVSQAHTSGVASMPLPFVSPSPPPPGCTLPSAIGDTRVISYTYDPLYRLSQAAYSSGECYQYAYDRVGNRTVMTTTVGTTTYQYDPANRLSSVNGQTYTWDNNGNLINDGSALYRYDRANRLISTTLNSTTSLFNYNGDGVRLKQIVAGVVTTYTQDLVAPLPVMLQAKTGVTTTKYLYATATRPLAQNSTAWEYLLPDALGSVRQMASANAYIIRTQDYEPYGSLLNGSGSGQSTYGFTGEEHDTYMKLVFLRARYYSPETARFLSKDMWQGDYTRPQSLDGWSYVEGDPINLTDPSGQQTQCPVGRWDCDAVNKVAALKDAFLDSASRHNRVPTMDSLPDTF